MKRIDTAIALEGEIRDRMRRLGGRLRVIDPELAGLLEQIAEDADGHARFLSAVRGGAMEHAALNLYGDSERSRIHGVEFRKRLLSRAV